MAPVLLKIEIVKAGVTKAVQLEESMTVYDACRHIREKVPEAVASTKGVKATSYSLFVPDEDPAKGYWLQTGRTLEYYHFKCGHRLQYRRKLRPLRVQTLDEAVRTALVDDSQPVSEITRVICARIGLHNPQEFSLTVDDKEAVLHQQHDHDRKLDTIRRELHTDDTLNWLDPHRTLREQGLVDETVVLTLRKKYFFSDSNVNANDPVQLHLLYVQCHEAIVEGTHPVTREEAMQLAALKCQVQFGNFEEGKFKKGFLKPSLPDFLPQEYRKGRHVEQDVLTEYGKLFGLTEQNAKFRYIELCRSLRTYGLSFFAVKEKMPHRNKLRPILLGINRESVVKLDMKTKDFLKTWPLTTICSYASTPHSFSLNFGAYSGSIYTVKTSEGESMVQLLDGYIDLILQTKKAATFELPEDVLPSIGEEFIQGQSPSVLKLMPGGTQHGEEGVVPQPATVLETMPEEPPSPGLPPAEQAFDKTVTAALGSVSRASEEMSTAAELPTLGGDKTATRWKQTTLALTRHKLGSHLSTLLTGSAALITLMSAHPQEADLTAMGAAAIAIGSSMGGAAESSRLLAALSTGENDSGKILDASRALADAIAALLGAAKPKGQDLQKVLSSSGEVATGASKLLKLVSALPCDGSGMESVGQLSKKVANGCALLVVEGKKIAAGVEDSGVQTEVTESIKGVESSVQALLASATLGSVYLESPLCQDGVMGACKSLASAIERLCRDAQALGLEGESLHDLAGAAATVTEALNALLMGVKAGNQSLKPHPLEEAYEAMVAEVHALQSSNAHTKEVLLHTKALAEATRALMHSLRQGAEKEKGDEDVEARRKVLNATKELADATSRLAELARGVASGQGKVAVGELNKQAEDILSIADSIVASPLKRAAFKRLQVASRQAASATIQLVTACQWVGGADREEVGGASTEMENRCKVVLEQVGLLVQALEASLACPEDSHIQLELVNTARTIISPTGKLVAAAKKAVPTVPNQASAVHLGNSAKHTATRLGVLRSAVAKAVEFCGSLVIDSAIATVNGLTEELEHCRGVAKEGKLHPLPGQSIESCSQLLVAAVRTIESLKPQLVSAATEKNGSRAGFTAREIGNNLRVIVQATCGLAAASETEESREKIFSSGLDVLSKCEALMTASKLVLEGLKALEDSGLLDAARGLSEALRGLLNCLPGQVEFDRVFQVLEETAASVLLSQAPPPDSTPYSTLEEGLKGAAAAVTSAVSDLLASIRGGAKEEVGVASLAKLHRDLLTAGVAVAAATQTDEERQRVLSQLHVFSDCSQRLLLALRAASVDPSGGWGGGQLTTASRCLVEAVNQLLQLCSAARPGVKECEGAVRELQALSSLLETAEEPVVELSYFSCINAITGNVETLSSCLALLPTDAGRGDHEALGCSIQTATHTLYEITEATAQAAYLVGVADPSSTMATVGVIDVGHLSRSAHLLTTACETVTGASSSKEELLVAAATLSKHSNVICSASKAAASRATSTLARREFLRAVKAVADSTAELLAQIDVLNSEPSEAARESCAAAARPLTEAVKQLTVFASSPEFSSTPAKISDGGHSAQQPILRAGRQVLSSMVTLVSMVRDDITRQASSDEGEGLVACVKSVTEAVEALVKTIEASCPGEKECAEAVQQLTTILDQLDQASHQAVGHALEPSPSSTLQGFLKQLISVSATVGDHIRPVTTAAKGRPEMIGREVSSLVAPLTSLAQAAIGAASHARPSYLQGELLQLCTTVLECAILLVKATGETRGNPQNVKAQAAVEEGARLLQEAVGELIAGAEEACAESGLVGGMIDEIVKALSHLEGGHHDDSDSEAITAAEFHIRLLKSCEAIAKAAHDMVMKGSSAPPTMAPLRRSLTTAYCQMVVSVEGTMATAECDESPSQLMESARYLGEALVRLLHSSAAVQVHPEDEEARDELARGVQDVKRKVSQVVSALQMCGPGTLACLRALAAIRDVVGDIDISSALLATAGGLQLGVEEEGGTTGSGAQRTQFLSAVKEVVEATQHLVESAQGSQEGLAMAAHRAMESLTSQAGLVKTGASAVAAQNTGGQLLLLSAVRDVTQAVEEVVQATSLSSGRTDSHPSLQQLHSSAKRAEKAGSRLLDTLSSVDGGGGGEDSGALLNTMEYVDSILEDFSSQVPWPRREPSPGDLLSATRILSLAVTKLEAGGKSPQPSDLAMGAAMARTGVAEVISASSARAWNADSEEERESILSASRECITSFRSLLEQLHGLAVGSSAGDEGRGKLEDLVQEVEACIEELLETAGEEGSEDSYSDSELPSAAAAITSAAQQLSEAQGPTEMTDSAPDSASPDFNTEVLEAVKAASRACGELVGGALELHKEVGGAAGRGWRQSVLSAAKKLAQETSTLCETANMYVQCHVPEEQLMTTGRSVALATAQLFLVLQVKMEAGSQQHGQLQRAAASVKKNADVLVSVAEQASIYIEGDSHALLYAPLVSLRPCLLKQDSEVARIQREMDQTRSMLARIRLE